MRALSEELQVRPGVRKQNPIKPEADFNDLMTGLLSR